MPGVLSHLTPELQRHPESTQSELSTYSSAGGASPSAVMSGTALRRPRPGMMGCKEKVMDAISVSDAFLPVLMSWSY